MRNDPEAIVDGFYRALIANDAPAQLTYFADDVIFCQHGTEGLMEYAGPISGKQQLTVRLAYMYEHWDVAELDPVNIRAVDEEVHAVVSFAFRYKLTGGIFEGRIRHVFKVFQGRIVRLDEYVDTALLEAFMRLNAPNSSGP